MYALILIPLITFVTLFAFVRSRKSHDKRYPTDQTPIERFLLSLSLSAAVQFLYVTIIPGWIAAAYVVGKGRFSQTPLGNEVFGTIMIISNIVIYFPIFYLLGLLFSFHSKRFVKMK